MRAARTLRVCARGSGVEEDRAHGEMQMSEAGMTFSGGLVPRTTGRVGQEAGRREGRVALASAAGLYAVGAALTASAALLPHVSSPAGVGAVAAAALLTAAGLTLAFARRRAGLT